jgi:hypothetical protein
VLDLRVKRERRLNVRLSQDEMCQLDSLFISLEIPMYSDEAGRNLSQSERLRMLLDVLAPKMDYWHWLKWSRVALREDGVLRLTRCYGFSPDDDS